MRTLLLNFVALVAYIAYLVLVSNSDSSDSVVGIGALIGNIAAASIRYYKKLSEEKK